MLLFLVPLFIFTLCFIYGQVLAHEQQASAVPTQEAKLLGITAANYPKIDGSTATWILSENIAAAMFTNRGEEHPEHSKTFSAYEKLLKGEVDLIFVPNPGEEIEKLSNNAGVELVYTPIAKEALIFITNGDNSVSGLTIDQIKAIYINNSIRNWQELGGPDMQLMPFIRNDDSGSQAQMDNLILEGQNLHPSVVNEKHIQNSMMGILTVVDQYDLEKGTYALGYTLYYYLENVKKESPRSQKRIINSGPQEPLFNPERLKILDIDGISANDETIGNGTYPLTINYFAVIRKDLPLYNNAHAIIYWLRTEAGRKCISQSNLQPY